MSSKPWPERSGPPAHGVLPVFTDGEGLQSLRYRGQLDEADPATISPSMVVTCGPPSGLADGILGESNQTPSVGCNVKWNPGQEPEWFG